MGVMHQNMSPKVLIGEGVRFIKLGGFLLGFLLFYGALSPYLASAEAKYANPQMLIETDEVAKLMGKPNVVIVDARRKPAYESAHIPGAVSIPYNALREKDDLAYKAKTGFFVLPETAEKVFRGAGISNDTRVIIYGFTAKLDNRPFAASLWTTMNQYGIDNVQVMRGGVEKWFAEGRPLTKDIPTPAPGNFKANLRPDWVATNEWVMDNADNVILVDGRTFEEYTGLNKAGNPRGGHASGAYSVQWTEMAGKETVKSAEEMMNVLKENGVPIDPNKTYVTYCNWGVGRGGSGVFYLKLLGLKNVRVGAAMEDWSTDPDLPMSTYETGKLE